MRFVADRPAAHDRRDHAERGGEPGDVLADRAVADHGDRQPGEFAIRLGRHSWAACARNRSGRPRLSARRYIITVPAIGSALAPDDVVTRAPRSTNMPNTGLSTPADIVCSQRRFGAPSATRKKAGARSGHASLEKNASVMRS